MKLKTFSLLCLCLACFCAVGMRGQAVVSPIQWDKLDTRLSADPLAQPAVQLFRQGLKYPVNDWYGKVKGFNRQSGAYLDFKGKTEHYIRPVSHMAFALAVALRFHVYDESVTGVSADSAKAIAVRLIASLAYRHKATLGEKNGWGNLWQSAWWASQTAFAALLCRSAVESGDDAQ